MRHPYETRSRALLPSVGARHASPFLSTFPAAHKRTMQCVAPTKRDRVPFFVGARHASPLLSTFPAAHKRATQCVAPTKRDHPTLQSKLGCTSRLAASPDAPRRAGAPTNTEPPPSSSRPCTETSAPGGNPSRAFTGVPASG